MQKFLVATGDLNDSIQQSLNLIVSDGKLNEGMSDRRLLDPKFPKNVMQKSNSVGFVFRDIAKFDTQNPIIGNLLNQIQSQKLTDEQVNQYLGKLPSVKDRETHERLEKLRDNADIHTRNIPSPPSFP